MRRIKHAPAHPADTVCRSATRLWPKVPDWQPPQESTALPPAGAGPRLAAPSLPAATRRSTIDPIAAAPAWKVESEVLCAYPCPSYKAWHFPRQVPIYITYLCGRSTRSHPAAVPDILPEGTGRRFWDGVPLRRLLTQALVADRGCKPTAAVGRRNECHRDSLLSCESAAQRAFTGAELAAAAHSAAAGFLTLSGDRVDLVRQGLLAHSR